MGTVDLLAVVALLVALGVMTLAFLVVTLILVRVRKRYWEDLEEQRSYLAGVLILREQETERKRRHLLTIRKLEAKKAEQTEKARKPAIRPGQSRDAFGGPGNVPPRGADYAPSAGEEETDSGEESVLFAGMPETKAKTGRGAE